MSCIATEISGICAKDLILSNEAKYTTCYNAFVRIMHKNDKATESSTETSANNHGVDEACEAVYAFCETVISNPRVIEVKEIRKVLADEAERLGVAVTQFQFENLLRMVSNKFKELELISYQQNKVLVYATSLKTESLLIGNLVLQSDLNRANQTSLGDDSKTVMNAAKVLNAKIKNHSVEMPWPPEEKDLGSNNVAEYIPELLDIFCTILLSGQALDRDKSKSDRVIRLKNSLTQDIVYSVSNVAIKTPKSVLFPAVVKALCNITEVVKLINKCGHKIGYNLIEEIETEFALKVINEQALNRVLIPDECDKPDNPPVALMVADNIHNLECTISGAGTPTGWILPLFWNKSTERERKTFLVARCLRSLQLNGSVSTV